MASKFKSDLSLNCCLVVPLASLYVSRIYRGGMFES